MIFKSNQTFPMAYLMIADPTRPYELNGFMVSLVLQHGLGIQVVLWRWVFAIGYQTKGNR